MTDPAAVALRRVVRDHGRHALDDPDALRVALHATTLTAAQVDVLVAVAGSGTVARLGSGGDDMQEARERTGLPAADAEWALHAFAEALDARSTGGYRIDWGDPIPDETTAGRRMFSRPSVVPSGTAIALAAALGIVLATVIGVVLVRGAPVVPPPDRHAIDQVAQRYRALGATLLDGALRCAPLQPEPGELERLDCSFGGWSVVLSSYDSPSRLADVRERAAAETTDSARQAAATGPDAAFAMRETAGDPPTATIYWDADLPRPVSASVTTTELALPDLVAFWDERGAAAIARPEVPGAAFDSAALWSLASSFVSPVDAMCGPVPAERPFPMAEEEVRCTYPNGVRVDFVLVDTAEMIYEYRRTYASPEGTVPDTVRVGGWRSSDSGELRGQLIEYVLAADRHSYLYFDDPTQPAFGLMFDARGQDELKSFWADVSSG